MSDPLLRFFAYEHLPPHLQALSRPLCELAKGMCDKLPPSAERTVALRKLLESKDAFVRAALPAPDENRTQRTTPNMSEVDR